MQVTVTCPDCSGFTSKKVEPGTVVQTFHNCNGPNRPPEPIQVLTIGSHA